MRIRNALSAFLLVFASAAALAQADHDHAPGPTAEKLGTVNFTISCGSAAQPLFNRAVALMHSFQFAPAIAGFHAVLAADPSCSIAWWGIAISDWGNPFAAGQKSQIQLDQGLKAITEARAVPAKTERERAYVEAVAHLYTDAANTDQKTRKLAYETAMAAVSAAYPDDTEAAIFYALALAAAADPSDKTYAKQLKAGAILDALYLKYPDHPGLAHYIIHTYDVPPLANRAVTAAEHYAQIAPNTPHALHMPSHTFTRIGEWQASIDTNIASAQAARREGQPNDELHASDYMIYAYLQTAQDNAARQVVASSAEIFSRMDPAKSIAGAGSSTAAYFARAAIPARYALERRDWAAAADLEPLASPYPYTGAITWFARGMGAAHLKDAPAAQSAIESLQQCRDKLIATKESYWAGQVEIQRQEVVAQLAFAEGKPDEAIAGMKAAAELEDKTEKNAITPGPLAPARELLGDMLLESNHPAEARKEFEATLEKEPNRFWSLYGTAEAAKQSGNTQAAHLYFQKLLKITERADQPGRRELTEARTEAARNDRASR